MKSLHPLTLLLIWLALLLWLQRWAMPWLSAATGVLLLLAAWRAGSQLLPLLRRTRWLMLVTALVFVWATPGEYVPGWSGVSYEGLIQGATHLLSLLLFVAGLALLLALLGVQKLVVALYAALRPLQIFGLDRDRAAVRLLLVFEYLEQPLPAGSWHQFLEAAVVVPGAVATPLSLPHTAWQRRDTLTLGVVLLLWSLLA